MEERRDDDGAPEGDKLDLDPDPPPARSDQLPEDAPAKHVPDDTGEGQPEQDDA
jgi:hypothetical protein